MVIFLSYNSTDKEFVATINQKLAENGFDTFFDKQGLKPGDRWPTKIEEGINQSEAALIFIGDNGIGPWQEKEKIALVNKETSGALGEYKVIPVILPSMNKETVYRPDWVLVNYQWVEFTSVSDQHALMRLFDGLRQSAGAIREIPIGKNPYKGLESFGVSDSDFFFGRTYELNQVFYTKLRLHYRFKDNNFLAVVGESGSGKSSFLQAGVVAAIKKGYFENSTGWQHLILKPGSDPLLALSTALKKAGLVADASVFEKNAIWKGETDHRALLRSIEEQDKTWVFYIDQFEEVLTQHTTGSDNDLRRQAFLDNLVKLIESEKALLLLSLRSDYYTGFSFHPAFKNLLESHNYTLEQVKLDEESKHLLSDIISNPARLAGVHVRKNLEAQLTDALKSVNGKLPVLQLALDLLWKQREKRDPKSREITLDDFAEVSQNRALAGIVEKHAENVFLDITKGDKAKEDLFRHLFVDYLIETREGKDDVRRTGSRSEILKLKTHSENEIKKMLEALSGPDARLITIDADKVNVMHEVIIREWPRLRNWLNNRRNDLLQRDRLEDIAGVHANDTSALLKGKQLKHAVNWKEKNPDLVTEQISTLTHSSQKRKRNFHLILGSMVAFFILASFWVYTHFQKRELISKLSNNTNPDIRHQWEAQGGHLDSIKVLIIDNEMASLIKGNLFRFRNLKNITLLHLLTNETLELFKEFEPIDSLNITIAGNFSLENLQRMENLNSLTISDNDSLVSLKGMENLNQLRSLTIYGNDYLESLKGMENLTQLESLTIENNSNLVSLKGMGNLNQLRSLTISGNSNLESLGLENFNQLDSLTILSNHSLRSLEGMENLKQLTSLTISGNSNLESLEGMGNLKQLTSLTIEDNHSLRTLMGLENLHRLRTLAIYDNRSLASLRGLEYLNQLRSLAISDNPSLASLQRLENLKQLESLTIEINYNLESLEGMENLKQLRSLTIYGYLSSENLQGMENLNQLRSLTIYNNSL